MSQGKNLNIPPKGAQRSNLVCHFCIVGCGYHVYKWPEGSRGGASPNQNALGLDFRKQLQPAEITFTPAMQNTITEKDGSRFHIAILPDHSCSVNAGLSSARGGKLASVMYGDNGIGKNRLLRPRLHNGSQWLDTSWEHALDFYSRLVELTLESQGPEGLIFDCFDHGGAGGGFENTWATGKLMFSAMRTPMVRIHNRPAYNSECHATREMGIGELNNSYEDAEIADCLMAIGCNPYETQTNYFLAHWLPNLRGQTIAKKQKILNRGDGARAIVVDPRYSTTCSIISDTVGQDRFLHLDILPGTDVALFNGLLTHVIERGWIDSEFIQQHTSGFEQAKSVNQMSLAETSSITGISIEKLERAARMAYEPVRGERPRTMHAYEKGIIWGNDNYLIQSALVNLVLATHNVGRPGTGVVRMGGHQEGYCRPPYPGSKKIYIDQEVIRDKGIMYTAWGANPFQTTLNAAEHRIKLMRRAQIVRDRLQSLRGASALEMADAAFEAAVKKKGLVFININLYPTLMQEAAHLMLPAAHPGEMNLTSMNGERRLRISQKFMDPPAEALSDCIIAAKIAQSCEKRFRANGKKDLADRFKGFAWTSEEDAFNDGFRRAGTVGAEPMDSQGGSTGHLATYERLIAAGNNGVQLPIKEFTNGKLIGTQRLYEDNKFDTKDGRAKFFPAKWNGIPDLVKKQKSKHKFWINNGRVNEVWQSAYHDQFDSFVNEKFPMTMIEMNPSDAKELKIESGDIVEVFNDHGSTFAMAYLEERIKTGQTFMQFAYPKGIAGDLTTPWTDRNLLPYYKGTWASIKFTSRNAEFRETISFKSRRYSAET
jgi:arsenite oxidase large subunit